VPVEIEQNALAQMIFVSTRIHVKRFVGYDNARSSHLFVHGPIRTVRVNRPGASSSITTESFETTPGNNFAGEDVAVAGVTA